jgi:hypothetical protein
MYLVVKIILNTKVSKLVYLYCNVLPESIFAMAVSRVSPRGNRPNYCKLD